MRVIHPLDRRAIEDWIDGCPDPDKGKEVLRSLASLKRGEAWVWSPEIGFGPTLIQFPLFSTYDSFAAPSGESAGKLKGWAEVDLAQRDAAKPEPDPRALEQAEAAGYARAMTVTAETLRGLRTAFQAVTEKVHELIDLTGRGKGKTPIVGGFFKNPPRRAANQADCPQCFSPPAERGKSARPPIPSPHLPPHAGREKPNGFSPALTRPKRKIIDSLAFWASIGHQAPSPHHRAHLPLPGDRRHCIRPRRKLRT
jgi:uncharacterized protein